MISVSAHEAAANNLRTVKGSISDLVTTLRSVQNDISENEVPGLDTAITQLSEIIAACLTQQSLIDGVANSIVVAAKQVYEEEMEAQRRILEEQRKKVEQFRKLSNQAILDNTK